MLDKPAFFDEINTLIKTISSALELPEADVAQAFEAGHAKIAFNRLPSGQPVIDVEINGRKAMIGMPISDLR